MTTTTPINGQSTGHLRHDRTEQACIESPEIKGLRHD